MPCRLKSRTRRKSERLFCAIRPRRILRGFFFFRRHITPQSVASQGTPRTDKALFLQESYLLPEPRVENAAKNIFIAGLRNAHSMEIQARELMERQSESLENYPEVQARAALHLAETNAQLRRLEQCLESCGDSTSSLKDAAQSIIANFLAMSRALADDEILKDTFKNFEIATYKSLLALAGPAGAASTRPLLETSLGEEQRMAQWINANIENVTLEYLRKTSK